MYSTHTTNSKNDSKTRGQCVTIGVAHVNELKEHITTSSCTCKSAVTC